MDIENLQTIITSVAIFGLAVGSMIGGPLVAKGRRRVMIGANLGGLLGSIVTLIHTGIKPNLYFLIAGRFIYPFSAGILLVAIPRFIDENLPPEISGPWGTSTNIFMNIGIMTCLFLGAGIP